MSLTLSEDIIDKITYYSINVKNVNKIAERRPWQRSGRVRTKPLMMHCVVFKRGGVSKDGTSKNGRKREFMLSLQLLVIGLKHKSVTRR